MEERMTTAVSPERILRDLHALWESLARETAPPEGHSVLRACAMTLIVIAEDNAEAAGIAQTLGLVMQEHPHRAVIVRVRSGSAPELGYQVTAQCWRPFGRNRQICCEQVEMAATEASLADAVPALLAITAPDLPVAVWCRSPGLFGVPALASLFARADRVIVDSRDFGDPPAALGLLTRSAAQGRGSLADLAWGSVTRWREIVAEIFEDPACRASLPRLQRLRVLHSAGAVPTTAFYLAGWILSALERDGIEAGFVGVEPVGGGIEGIALEAAGSTISIRRAQGTAVLIEIDGLRNCTAAPRLSEAELLGTELGVMGRDPVFERTLPVAARIAARAPR
jgi:glucose-6-phosphate dehydrogenase assembly protein OpcA